MRGLGYPFAVFVRGRRLALACVLAAIALGGCSSGDKPVALPSLSPSTSPSASPSATSTADTAAAAVGVVRAYYAIVNNLHRRMDAAALSALMTKSCTCQQQVRAVAEAAAKGEHYIDRARLVSVTPAVNSPTSVDVLVEYNASRGGLVDASGHQVTSAYAKDGIKRLFHVREIGGRWLIVEIDVA